MHPLQLAFTKTNRMSKFYKLVSVLGGYFAAFVVALAVAYVFAWMRQSESASGGMQAFGDLLGFLGLFGVLSLVPTALALYFLRSVQKFWTFLSLASLALAACGLLGVFTMRMPHLPSWAPIFAGLLGVLLVMGSPLIGFGFAICAVISPFSRSRWRLLVASGVEFCVGAYAFVSLFFLGHWIR